MNNWSSVLEISPHALRNELETRNSEDKANLILAGFGCFTNEWLPMFESIRNFINIMYSTKASLMIT